jgi:hypothetical protein
MGGIEPGSFCQPLCSCVFFAISDERDGLLNGKDLRTVDCAIHASPYMGIAGGSRHRGFFIENLAITPSQGRHLSTTTDGVHLTGTPGDVIIDHATFEALGDDAINMGVVWDTLTRVTSSKSFSMTGADGPANPGETLAFFDEGLAFVGSARVQSSVGSETRAIESQNGVDWLRPGIKAIYTTHIPSHFYISNVTVRNKIGRGMLIGGLHGLIPNSTFDSVTMTGILFHFSSYWSEGAPGSDIAIRNNQFTRMNLSRDFANRERGWEPSHLGMRRLMLPAKLPPSSRRPTITLTASIQCFRISRSQETRFRALLERASICLALPTHIQRRARRGSCAIDSPDAQP